MLTVLQINVIRWIRGYNIKKDQILRNDYKLIICLICFLIVIHKTDY